MEVLSGFHDHWFILQTAFLLVVIIVIIVISVLFVATAAVQCSFITPLLFPLLNSTTSSALLPRSKQSPCL